MCRNHQVFERIYVATGHLKLSNKDNDKKFSGLASTAIFLMIVLAPIGYLEAQERTSGASALDVRNRIHPDWNPLGIRAGGFLIHPSVEAAAEFDDNIYRHHQNKDSDTIYSIRSRVFGISQWSRHQLQFDASIDSANYAQADGEDTTDWVVGLAGRVDINRNAWIDADLSFQEDHEGRGSPEQQDRTLEPVENTIADLGIKGTYRWNRFSLAVGGRYAEREHENGVKAVVPPPPPPPPPRRLTMSAYKMTGIETRGSFPFKPATICRLERKFSCAQRISDAAMISFKIARATSGILTDQRV